MVSGSHYFLKTLPVLLSPAQVESSSVKTFQLFDLPSSFTLCRSTDGLLHSAAAGTKCRESGGQKPRVHLPAPAHGRPPTAILIMYLNLQ